MMQSSLVTLFCVNLAFVLFPVISPGRDPMGSDALFLDQVTVFGQVLSSGITPLLVAGTLAMAMLERRQRPVPGTVLFPAGAVALLILLSAAFGEVPRVQTPLMAVFFLLFTLYLTQLKDRPAACARVLSIFKACFTGWMLAPLVAMALDPSLFDMFFVLTAIDVSYHGLANSRVGYGLWISAFIILIGRPRSRSDKLLLAVALVTLLLSQSRAALAGLLLAYAYSLVRDRDRSKPTVRRLVLLAAACAVPLAAWTMFGRDDALTVLSDDRGFILARFTDYIELHWLFGHGGMLVMDMPEIDRYDVPAHNFAVQTVANYGAPALLAFLAYFVGLFRYVRSTRARMLLLFLFVYGLNQPVQGTGNFFNPITLLYFLLAFSVEGVERRRAEVPSPRPNGATRRQVRIATRPGRLGQA